MPEAPKLAKAKITEMWPDTAGNLQVSGAPGAGGSAKEVLVQFNPQTLKVNFSNQRAGGDQKEPAPLQFVGSSTTKLSLELWFDATLPLPDGSSLPSGDVRELTREIAYFMEPREITFEGKKQKLPPALQFQWGTFVFEGVMDSLDETLEMFSEDGKPLRAGVSISVSQQKFQFQIGPGGGAAPGIPGGAGTAPQQVARAGESLQQLAGRMGRTDWQSIAAANGIENPRQLAAGTPLNLGLPR
jgi:hypothetical protein